MYLLTVGFVLLLLHYITISREFDAMYRWSPSNTGTTDFNEATFSGLKWRLKTFSKD